MQRFGRQVLRAGQNLRHFSSVSEYAYSPCRTEETNPVNHGPEHEGRFYKVPEPVRKQLFTHGGLIKQFVNLTNTWDELAFMIRKPATEVISYLKETNFNEPVNRYVIYGKEGTGKSTTLAHILHYGSATGYLIVHVPWVPLWFRNHSIVREITPSATKPGMFEQPTKAVEWLKHFSLQNGPLLKQLNFKTTDTYTWSKREVTLKDSTWSQLIDLGMNRAKYATDCIHVLLKEIKNAAINNKSRVLVVIDGFNAFFSSKSMARREDKTVIRPSEFTLSHSFLSITSNDWNNGAVVVSVDAAAHPGDMRGSHLPRYLLGKEGFEHLDPFIPVEVTNYSHKEVHSQINYYIDRQWLIQPGAHTEAGRNEILHASGANPYSLMQIVAPY